MKISAAAIFAATTCIALATPATLSQAHHGFYMDYETKAAYWLEGEVVDGYFGMPHADLIIKVDKDPMPPEDFEAENAEDLLKKVRRAPWDVRGKTVEVEFPQQKAFYDLDGVFEKGDRVAVLVYRGCKRPYPLRGQWVLLPDETSLRAKGKVQREIKYCPRNDD